MNINDEDEDYDYGFEDETPQRGNKVRKFKRVGNDGDRDFKRERDRQRAEKSKRQLAD